MPELPEVEIIRLGLEKHILGKILKKIEVLSPKTFQGNPKEAEGKKVVGVWRRAKMLGLELASVGSAAHSLANASVLRPADGEASDTLVRQLADSSRARSVRAQPPSALTLLFHLKMTGQLILVYNYERLIGGHPTEDMKGQMPSSSTRVIFEFSDKSKLYFNDQRRFGWVKIIDNVQCKIDNLGKLGPEPFDKKFTWQILKNNLFKHKSMPVKVAIMDQSVVSGVGNIYSSEALFLAKIDPRRKVSTLNDGEFKKVYEGIKKSLETGIKHGGSTRAHFVNVEGERGYFLDYANVYGKEGYKCKGCPGKVQKVQLGGRGTYFCPSCQK